MSDEDKSGAKVYEIRSHGFTSPALKYRYLCGMNGDYRCGWEIFLRQDHGLAWEGDKNLPPADLMRR